MRCFYYTLSNFLQINIKYVNEIVLLTASNHPENGSWKICIKRDGKTKEMKE